MTQQTTDDKIQAMLDNVAKVRADVSATEAQADKAWLTNCSFSFNWNGTDPKNIQTMSLEQVFQAAQWLKLIEQAGELVDLDLPQYVGKWQGVDISQWESDLSKRIARINLQGKKAKLKQIEDSLNSLISPELRAKLELERLTKELAGL